MPKALFVGGCPASYHRLEPMEQVIRSIFSEIGVEVDFSGIYHPDGSESYTGDYSILNPDQLGKYDILVIYTTGSGHGEDVGAILEFLRGGGALIGIHCATDSFVDNPEYIAAIGGRFRTHPAPLDIEVTFTDPSSPITRDLPSFTVHDELYLFRDYDASRVHLLAETTSYDGEGSDTIPVAWTRTEGKGKVFYLSLGHDPQALMQETAKQFLQRGVLWTIGQLG